MSFSLKKFLTKHSEELKVIALVLGSVVRSLPIDGQDKANLGKLIKGLEKNASNIAKAAKDMPNGTPAPAAAPIAKPVADKDK